MSFIMALCRHISPILVVHSPSWMGEDPHFLDNDNIFQSHFYPFLHLTRLFFFFFLSFLSIWITIQFDVQSTSQSGVHRKVNNSFQQHVQKNRAHTMTRLGDILASIEALCDTMNKLDFGPPGIFTNAIINKPDVTSLIRDPSEAELSVYKIVKGNGLGSLTLRQKDEGSGVEMLVDLQPRRIDGKSVFEEFEENDSGAVVRVPRLVDVTEDDTPFESMSSPTKRKVLSQYKLISTAVLESEDFDIIFKSTSDVVLKHPNIVSDTDVSERLERIRREYFTLLEETRKLEDDVRKQKEDLGAHGESVFEFGSPGRDVDDLIRQEEDLIKDLEEDLEAIQA